MAAAGRLLNLNKSFNFGQISLEKLILKEGDSHIEKIAGKHGLIKVSTFYFQTSQLFLAIFLKIRYFFLNHLILNS